jgi:hypothetical protein
MTGNTLPALLIGAVLGDSDTESMAWSHAIGTLSRKAEELSVGLSTPVRVNVVYHVNGRILPNEFEGLRTGRFDKPNALLVVQAAVPARMPDQPQKLLLELLEAAIVAAEAFAKRKNLADDLSDLRGLVDRVAVAVQSS